MFPSSGVLCGDIHRQQHPIIILCLYVLIVSPHCTAHLPHPLVSDPRNPLQESMRLACVAAGSRGSPVAWASWVGGDTGSAAVAPAGCGGGVVSAASRLSSAGVMRR